MTTDRLKRWAQHDAWDANISKIRPPTILCFELSTVPCLKGSSDSLLASRREILGDKNLTKRLYIESVNLDKSLLQLYFSQTVLKQQSLTHITSVQGKSVAPAPRTCFD
jgi:hypothetical protein